MTTAVHAKIATPTLTQLVLRSPEIVSGHVLAIVPTPFSPVAQMLVVLVLAIIVTLKLRRKWRGFRLFSLMCGVVVLGILAIAAVQLATYARYYEYIALVRVDRTLRGQIRGIVPVSLRTSFVCDISDLNVGGQYVFFLERSMIGYQPSWYDWSFWQIHTGVVDTRRTREEKVTSYEAFVNDVAAIQRNERLAFSPTNRARPNLR